MLRQLVKHEFRATGRMVPFVYLITIVMAAMNLLTARIGIRWLFTMTMVFLILLAVAEVVVTYVLVISRYYKNLYGNEGYLMHTLPVPTRNLLVSKILASFVWLTVSYLIVLGVILTVVASVAEEVHFSMSEAFKLLLQQSGLSNVTTIPVFLIVVAAYALLAIGNVLAQVFFSITLGSSARFHKLGIAGPIVIYLLVNFASQLLSLASIAFIPLGLRFATNPAGQLTELKPAWEGMFGMMVSGTQTSGIIGLGSILFMLIATVGLLIATDRIMAKKTSLR